MLAALFRRGPSPSRLPVPLSSAVRLTGARHVSRATQHGETVLLDRHGGVYYALNESGAFIWEMLRGGTTFAAIVEALDERYDAPRAQLTDDARALLDALLAARLVEAEGAPA